MLRLEVAVPAHLADAVVDSLKYSYAISHLSRLRGAAVRPEGDLIIVDVAREAVNDIISHLEALDVDHEGTLQLRQVPAWISKAGLRAEQEAPGAGADAVVWLEVVSRAYDDSELNFTFLSFMTMATLLAGIAIILDSQVLTVGAMVLGPEFGPIAALGVALVRRRFGLLRHALRSLAIGFAIAIAVTLVVSLMGRGLGWVHERDIVVRPATAFIYSPDRWSVVVALIAAAAGVLSITSAKSGGLSGVFISVTTIPAAGNLALAAAFGNWHEMAGSVLQLVINIGCMGLAGWVTLLVQQWVWSRVDSSSMAPRVSGQQQRHSGE